MDIGMLTHEFQAKVPTYEHLKGEALFILEQALLLTDIKLHLIQSRVKKVESFLDKVQRKELKTPFEEVNDIVGIRVVCLFLSDVERIVKVVRKVFAVLAEDNKVDGAEVASFGYMSFHLIAQMKNEYQGPRYNTISKIPFEIQVRTIAMDAWANVSHYLDYKSEDDVPRALKRDFYALSGLFYVADRHFEMFMKSSVESRREMGKAFGKVEPPLEEEVNLDSLRAYLLNKFPDRKHSDAKAISELIGELSEAGIRSISYIDRAVDTAREAFRVLESENLPYGGAYTDVGAVRGSLGLTDDNYRQVTGESNRSIYHKYLKHKSLVKNKVE